LEEGGKLSLRGWDYGCLLPRSFDKNLFEAHNLNLDPLMRHQISEKG